MFLLEILAILVGMVLLWALVAIVLSIRWHALTTKENAQWRKDESLRVAETLHRRFEAMTDENKRDRQIAELTATLKAKKPI